MTLTKNQKILTFLGFLIFLGLVIGLILLGYKLYQDSSTQKTVDVSEQMLTVNDLLLRKKVKVIDIIDGDTIKVISTNGEERIRLLGIDTPEMSPKECFAQEAKDKISELTLNKEIWLEDDESQGDKDRYGRLLRYLYLENTDTNSVNEIMVEDGFAYEYTYSKPYRYQDDFKEAEVYAANNSLGLWDKCY